MVLLKVFVVLLVTQVYKVHGGYARSNQFPYHVAVEMTTSYGNHYLFRCNGALIKENYVLTSARCVSDNLAQYRIALPSFSYYDKNVRRIPISNITIHKDFNFADKKNDIAILQLTESVHDKSIAYQSDLSEFYYESEYIMTSYRYPRGGRLVFSKVEMVDEKACEQLLRMYYWNPKNLLPFQFCSNTEKNWSHETDILVDKSPNGMVLVGLGSINENIFTSVSPYVDWINSVVNNAADNDKDLIELIDILDAVESM
ncbi:chymotrypsin-like elastase family member 2B [Copidosoma floridanum]|uniref:chymotrypsin-like elastase family member 2B n=1 Tax=Copidosoma floridanum TaxID=29053 RepID=UPI0006C9BCCC|nr:chymotrypsin-like elastase family member 2B [Copidosoma floridanum]